VSSPAISTPPKRLILLRALQLRELSLRMERQPSRVPRPKDVHVVESAASLLERFAGAGEIPSHHVRKGAKQKS